MKLLRTLPRLTIAGAVLFGGLSIISMSSSSASPDLMSVAHGGRVVFPTVGSARDQRVRHTAGLSRLASSFVLSSHGGLDGIEVTTGTPKVYVVFYGSQWGTESTNSSGYATFSGDPTGLAPRVQALLAGIGTNNELWSGVMTQYCDGVASGTTVCPNGATHVGYPTGGALAGVWYDNSVASPTQATGHQLAAEAVAAAGHFNNTTAASNRSAQYVIVSPTATHPDGFNTAGGKFCAYHDFNGDTTLSGGAAPSNYGDIAFTNLPFITDMGASCGANYVNAGAAGSLDGVSIVEGHEYAETLTDQNAGYGWYDNTTGEETGDVCAWVGTGGAAGAQDVAFATGSFAMQSTWSNSNNSCEISGPVVTGQAPSNDFSLSASPSAGSVVQGSSTITTVSTATISGAAQNVALSVSGLPTGSTATFSPSAVTSGASSSLSIQTSSTTPTGTYSLSISGTATSGVHVTNFSLKVNPVATTGTFSIVASPATGSTGLNSTLSTTIVTATTSGSAQSVRLSASGLPSGVSAAFSPTTVTSGGTSTLKFTISRRARAGTYTVTVSGTGTSSSASTTYRLTD